MVNDILISSTAYVKTTNSTERAVFASSSIPAGSLVLKIEDPLICIPDDAHLNDCCSYCMTWRPEGSSGSIGEAYSEDVTLSYCLGCRVVKYCKKSCQKADWKRGHSYECKIYKALYPRILPTTVRAIIRMAKLFLSETPNANVVGGIGALKAHSEDFMKAGGEQWEMMNLSAKAASEYSKLSKKESFDPEFMRDLYCKLVINSFTATSQTFDPIGICMDFKAAMINHSCVPNCVMLFDGNVLSVRSITDISKDSEITISYIDVTKQRELRQAELKQRYFFLCSCTSCQSDSNPWDGYLCQDCGSFIPIDKQTCPKCENKVNPEAVNLSKQGYFAIEATAKAFSTGDISKLPPTINRMVKALKMIYQSKSFPPVHQPLPDLHQTLAQAYISTGDWPTAFRHLLTLYVTVDPIIYKVPFHPVRVVRNFTLLTVLIQVATTAPEAFPQLDWTKLMYGLLVETAGNVDKSHGEDSGLAKIVKRKMREVEIDIGIDSNHVADKWFGKGLAAIPGLESEVRELKKIVKDFEDGFRKTG